MADATLLLVTLVTRSALSQFLLRNRGCTRPDRDVLGVDASAHIQDWETTRHTNIDKLTLSCGFHRPEKLLCDEATDDQDTVALSILAVTPIWRSPTRPRRAVRRTRRHEAGVRCRRE